MNQEYITTSDKETKKLGEKLAKKFFKRQFDEGASVIGLEGELGAGKTTFLQGFAKGLGIKEKILSPTFIIYRKFEVIKNKRDDKSVCQKIGDRRFFGTHPKTKPKIKTAKGFQYFYHFDCYRIQKPKELLELGFREIILNPCNIVAVEWAERVKKIMPKRTIWIKFKLVDTKTREITIR